MNLKNSSTLQQESLNQAKKNCRLNILSKKRMQFSKVRLEVINESQTIRELKLCLPQEKKKNRNSISRLKTHEKIHM